MIVLNVTYKCSSGMREAFLDSIRSQGVDAACRAEDGNLQYDYYRSADADDELLLVEKWRDGDALAAHGAQAHMEKLRELKAQFVTETVIERFDTQS